MRLKSASLVSVVVVLWVVVAITAGCPAAQPIKDMKPTAPALPALIGKYESDCTAGTGADGMTSYEKTALDVSAGAPGAAGAGTWARDVVVYNDDKCTTKSGTMHDDGGYTMKAPSATLPGAFDVELTTAHRTLTPHVDGYIALMQSYGCGKTPYAVNQPQDVLASGCKDLGFVAANQCATAFDVVKIDAQSLVFGKRPGDGDQCSVAKRPSALGVILKRRT